MRERPRVTFSRPYGESTEITVLTLGPRRPQAFLGGPTVARWVSRPTSSDRQQERRRFLRVESGDLAQSNSGSDASPIRSHPRHKRGEVEAQGSFGTCLQRSLTGPGRDRPRQRHDFPAKWRRDCGRYRPSSTVPRTWRSGWDAAQVWDRGRSRLLRSEDGELSGRRFQGTC